MADLHDQAGAVVAHTDNVLTHVQQDGLHGLVGLHVAADVDAQLAGDSGGLGLNNGSVDELGAGGLDHLGDLDGSAGLDGAHVDAGLGLVQSRQDGLVNSLGMLGLGNHGDDDVHVLSQLQRGGGGLGADGSQLIDLGLNKVKNIDLVVVLLNDVLAHGLAHDAQSDKTDFHVAYILSDDPNSVMFKGVRRI